MGRPAYSVDGGVVFGSETDFDGFEGDADSAEDEGDGDGVDFAEESLAVHEGAEEACADKEEHAGEGHEHGRTTAQQQKKV